MRSLFPGALHFDLLESDYYHQLLARPQLLDDLIPTTYRDWVVLDEIQKVPELLNEVHRLIERRKLKFALTGSSARSLRKKGVNLLAGRAVTKHLFPLTVQESKKDFDLAHALKFGMLPSVFGNSHSSSYLASYVRTYLKEEVQQEGLVRNLPAFARFLESATFSQGSVLNMSEVARDCGIHRKVVADYFVILEDLLLACRVPVFTKKAKRDLLTSEKFFFFDNGVYRELRPRGPLDSTEGLEGVSLETLLFQEIRALNEYLGLGYGIYYWRTKQKQEIDFVLYGKAGLIAIEVKRSNKPRGDDLDALRLFKSDYPMARCFLAYGGTKRFIQSDIECVPYEDFLRKLPEFLR